MWSDELRKYYRQENDLDEQARRNDFEVLAEDEAEIQHQLGKRELRVAENMMHDNFGFANAIMQNAYSVCTHEAILKALEDRNHFGARVLGKNLYDPSRLKRF